MAAPEKNKNAQKWNERKVMYYLRRIEREAENKKCLFLGMTLAGLGLYRDAWRYWKAKFGEIETIADLMERIGMMLENNVLMAGLRWEIPARVAILTLRNAHGWRNDPDRRAERNEEPAQQNVKVIPMYNYTKECEVSGLQRA